MKRFDSESVSESESVSASVSTYHQVRKILGLSVGADRFERATDERWRVLIAPAITVAASTK